MESEERASFRIPECNMGELEAQIEKLARKASKLGLKPPQLITEGHEDIPLVYRDNLTDMLDFGCDRGHTREERNPGPKDKIVGYRRYIFVRLEGEAPTLPGWKLVAVIEHGDTELGNIIRVAPGMDGKCPASYRTAGPFCGHCKTTRRRLETFLLLKDADASYLQVGRQCLGDFLMDPGAAARLCGFAEILASARGFCSGAEDEDFFGMGTRATPRAPVEAVLAVTARIIRHCGWLSRSKAKEDYNAGTPTANLIEHIFFDPAFWKEGKNDSNETRALRAAAKDVTPKDTETATASLAWVRSKKENVETLSDYEYNLCVVASEETVLRKHFGLLCSGVAAYQRHLEQAAAKAAEAKIREASQHFGELKARGRWRATLMAAKAFEGDSYGYGSEATVRWMLRFLVNDRDIAVWWTGKEPDVVVGDTVWILGTVKEHSEYKGTKQTTLTRCDVYYEKEVGHCTNCGAVVLRNDLKKNCPTCKKRGLKVSESWFPGFCQDEKIETEPVEF